MWAGKDKASFVLIAVSLTVMVWHQSLVSPFFPECNIPANQPLPLTPVQHRGYKVSSSRLVLAFTCLSCPRLPASCLPQLVTSMPTCRLYACWRVFWRQTVILGWELTEEEFIAIVFEVWLLFLHLSPRNGHSPPVPVKCLWTSTRVLCVAFGSTLLPIWLTPLIPSWRPITSASCGPKMHSWSSFSGLSLSTCGKAGIQWEYSHIKHQFHKYSSASCQICKHLVFKFVCHRWSEFAHMSHNVICSLLFKDHIQIKAMYTCRSVTEQRIRL